MNRVGSHLFDVGELDGGRLQLHRSRGASLALAAQQQQQQQQLTAVESDVRRLSPRSRPSAIDAFVAGTESERAADDGGLHQSISGTDSFSLPLLCKLTEVQAFYKPFFAKVASFFGQLLGRISFGFYLNSGFSGFFF